MFGAATSAYQIEGGWNEDGKGENFFDNYFHTRGANVTGDVACDSYHKWQEDVQNVIDLGLQFYRFSISWSRILPDGTLRNINQKGIDYYLNIIKALKANGIEPLVTIFHYDAPMHMAKLGGFLNQAIVDYFGDYARLLYSTFGEYVKFWITINEPTIVCLGYGSNTSFQGLGLIGDGIYQCGYTVLKAHARAYRIYENEFKTTQKGKVSIAIEGPFYKPFSPSSSSDIQASQRALEFRSGWFADPIYLGNWPKMMIDRIGRRSEQEGLARSRLPAFTNEELEYIKGTSDYYAFNVYGTATARSVLEAAIGDPSYDLDLGVSFGTTIDNPTGIRDFLNWIKDRYHPKEIMITENGKVNAGGLDDDDRIEYIKGYLSSILDSIYEDNVNVIGYAVWSLMDNFEWRSYAPKFGLIEVDFDSPNRTRTWKKSAYWYKNVTNNRYL